MKDCKICTDDGYKINRSLTPIQKELGVNILNVNVETGECTYV